MIWEYYENTAINGFLITKIKDFSVMKKYLDINYYHYSHSDKEPYLDDIKISCDVRLGATKKSISDIMEMGEGTIIELDRLTGEPADFRVNGVTIARGDVIVIDENFGIRLTEIL